MNDAHCDYGRPLRRGGERRPCSAEPTHVVTSDDLVPRLLCDAHRGAGREPLTFEAPGYIRPLVAVPAPLRAAYRTGLAEYVAYLTRAAEAAQDELRTAERAVSAWDRGEASTC